MYKRDLEKTEEPEIKLSTSVVSQKKQQNSRKEYFQLIDSAETSDCVDQSKLWKVLNRWANRPHYLFSEKPV